MPAPPHFIQRLLPALKFAFWTYFWTVGMFLLFVFLTEFSNRHSTGPEVVWNKPEYYWGILKGCWRFPLPILLAGLLASLLDPRWYKGFTLILTPFVTLLVWKSTMTLWVASWMLPAALLASLPDLLRSRRRNRTHIP